MDNQLRQIIEEAWNDRALLAESRVREAVRAVIEELDKGRLRTAEPIDPSRSQWQVNEWVKKAYGSCRTPWPATELTFRRGRS